MTPKATAQSCIFLIENMVLFISSWANYCENKPKHAQGSENAVENSHALEFNYANWVSHVESYIHVTIQNISYLILRSW